MRVKIFHNVQEACMRCGFPVRPDGPDRWRHLTPDADHEALDTRPVGYDGYTPGHRMILVFETGAPDGEDPHATAERMFEMFNVGTCDTARAYRARNLRSLSVGDVVAVGDVRLAVARMGFTPAEGQFMQVWTGQHGSRPVPHCQYCLATEVTGPLEPFNRAGNLACKDVKGCSDRMNAS